MKCPTGTTEEFEHVPAIGEFEERGCIGPAPESAAIGALALVLDLDLDLNSLAPCDRRHSDDLPINMQTKDIAADEVDAPS